jgi:tripartite-type tricarboxylate transporter receptor subunit TctC
LGWNLAVILSPVKTLAELIAYAKANPDKLTHSSSGNSTVSHIAMEELKPQPA